MSGPPLDLAPAQRGAITWVTLLFLLTAVVGGYLLWVWAPVYYENYAVKQVVRDYMNQAVKNPNDAHLRANMVAKLRSLAEMEGLDAYGRPTRVPAIVVAEQDVTWERDTQGQPPMLRVSFDYSREVVLPFLDRTATKVFTVDLSNDLTVPNWGPAR
jgi:hypothetical protein